MRTVVLSAFLLISAIGCRDPLPSSSSSTNSTTMEKGDAGHAADNTGTNKRDRDSKTLTPLDQSEKQSDIDITAGIRKRIVDSDVSINARNIKIITQDGKVTLRGPVNSAEEKQKIEDLAKLVTGIHAIDNQLDTK